MAERDDHDLSADAFDGLDLDALSEGVHATPTQWSTIASAASARRRRRTWMVAAAAMVVLVLGSAAVVLNRQGDDATIDLATGGSTNDTYVLPPEDATVLQAWVMGDSYGFQYRDTQGKVMILRRYSTDFGDTVAVMERWRSELGALVVDIPPFGSVAVACSNASISASGDGTSAGTMVTGYRGAPMSMWMQGSYAMNLVPDGNTEDPCTPPTGGDLPIVSSTAALRVVEQPAWDDYIAGLGALVHRIDPSMADSVAQAASGSTMVPSTSIAPSTTVPEQPPTDRASAEEQIAAAVAGFDVQAADGSYPNLEDGATKAAEYQQMFATAARQSGAAAAGDGSGNRTELSRLTFVSPERASITMELTAVLPSGTFTFGQQGEAILQDGRWVVTYRTVITTLGRACTPPGGYDGCPAR